MRMNVKDLKIIMATHVFTTVPGQHLLEFCVVNKIKKALYIEHPLVYQKGQKGSGWQLYKKGRLEGEHYTPHPKGIGIRTYAKQALLNVWWGLKSKEHWDLYVGSDNLNAFCGILLKRLGRVGKVVYYVIDYVPKRFENRILDRFYHWVDIFCVKNCDIIWNLSPRMAEAREKYSHLDKKYRAKQIVVPEGVWLERIQRYPWEQIKPHQLVFLGHLNPRLGVQKVIEAIPEIIKIIPDFKFIVIGKGDYRPGLEELARNLGVEGHIEFKGFIPSHREVERVISRCAIGIAPYSDEEGAFSYFCDPSKTKVYMGCGLPVIMTDVFYNAREIEEAGAGRIVGYNAEEIAKAVVEMMQNREKLRQYRKGAVKYIEDLDWNIIFQKNLTGILDKK